MQTRSEQRSHPGERLQRDRQVGMKKSILNFKIKTPLAERIRQSTHNRF